MMSAGRGLRFASIALLAVSLSACGGVPGSTGPARHAFEVLSAASETTKDAGSSRISIAAELSFGSQSGAMTAEGSFDYEARLGSMEMRLESPDGDFTVQLILDGTTIYEKLPVEARLPFQPAWVKVDLAEAGQDIGGGFGTAAGNPAQMLDYLEGVSNDVEEVGTDSVRGVETMRYTATIDLTKVDEAIPSAGAGLDQTLSQLGSTTLPMDVWVDAHGLVRRLRFSMEFGEGSDHASMDMQMDLYDFGVDVEVTPPSDSEVMDFSEYLESSGA